MTQIRWCAFLILLIHSQINAQDIEWTLLLVNGKELSEVTPTSVSPDSLMFRSALQNSAAVEISQIRKITYRDGPSKGGKGFVIGLLTGGAVGFVAGLIADGTSGSDQSGFTSSSNEDETSYKVILPVAGGVVGGIAGYAIGAASGSRSLDLSSMSNDQKRESLARLLNPGFTQPLITPAIPSPQRDVLYLKNGSIVRGTILEMIPDSTLRLVTADSSVFVFRMSEVERVAKESGNVPLTPPSRRVEQRPPMDEPYDAQPSASGRFRFGLFVGGGFPVGEFGSTTETNGGAAKAGFALGGEVAYPIKDISFWVTSVAVAFNAFDQTVIGAPSGVSVETSSWVTIWPMSGIRLSPTIGGNTSFYVQGQIGLLVGNSPELVISSSSASVTQPSSSAPAFAFSVGAGFLAGDRLAVGGRYLYGSPEYQVTASSGSQSATGKFKQPTGILLLTVGVML